MQPLHTIDNKQLIKFHPVETNLISKMVGQETTAINTYKDLIESAETRAEQAKFEGLLKNHMLAKDFWKKEIIARDLKTEDIRGFRTSLYRFLVNVISKFSNRFTLYLLKKYELMNLSNYKKIITSNHISQNLKVRINRLFLYNQRRSIQRINVFLAA